MNYTNKIPDLPSVIVTTEEELGKIKTYNKNNATVLPYHKGQELNSYIITLLAAYRVGYKEKYSEILFSIDPGTKHFGLVVFIEDFFLKSYTFIDQRDLIKTITLLMKIFKADANDEIFIAFKFGSGILSLAIDIVAELCSFYSSRRNMRFYLVDEAKTSKIKLPEKFPKHEASALIIALREGIEINASDLKGISYQIKLKNHKKGQKMTNKNEKDRESHISLGEILKKVLLDEIGLSQSIRMIHENKIQV